MRNEEIEMIKCAKDKVPEASYRVYAEYKHLVVAISRKYFLIGGDHEDLIQEGMIGLFKAVDSFDSSRNNNFSGYASMLIEREIISAIRRANAGNQQALSDSVFIENDDELGDATSPESDFIHEEQTLELTNEIYKNLSKFEKQVVEYFLRGYDYKDIAKLMGKTPKTIDNALSRSKKKLEYLKERL